MSLLMNLNEHQSEAVTCIDRHLRIIAGAGSGKTRVVTTRIAYLIQEKKVWPNKVLAITFTNKAAKEMKERVYSILGDVTSGVQISTIHSFCVRLLREDIYEMGYPRNFTILDSDDQKSILKEAYKQLEVDVKAYSYGNMLGYISNNKTQFVDPEEAKSMANKWNSEEIKANVYAFYAKRLKEMMALDFDDLLIFAHNLLKHHDAIRSKWQNRFRYIHVDEFQDVDVLQYNLIKFLIKEDSVLCVVGDPDQTIYTWRGAKVDIIMNFEKDFQNCKTVVLNENYRSTQAILNGANALIRNNKNRIDKELFTKNEGDALITHFSAMDDNNEPIWVSSRIKILHNDGVNYRDIAILYRSNYLSRSLERAFLDANIPYRIYGGIRFYDRAEIKDALCYLRLLGSGDELDQKEMWKDLAVKRVINSPKRGIGAKTMEALVELAHEHDTNLYEALKYYPMGKGKASIQIHEFVRVIEEARALVDDLSIDLLLENLLENSGYMHMLQEEKEIERLENIKELLHDIENFVQHNPDGGLDEYLQMITLYTEREDEGQADAEFVQLMTIHASKGLEFDNVFVYSLSEGVFPSDKSVLEGGSEALEEERRLAYVAFTRARQRLYLSDAQGYSYVLDRVKKTSRFIKEIPEEYVDEVGVKVERYQQSYDRDYGYTSQDVGMSVDTFLSNQSEEVYNARPLMPPKRASIDVAPIRKGVIKKGDLITHTAFGDGVVISVKEGLATIAFDKKFGIRKLMANHPSITRK